VNNAEAFASPTLHALILPMWIGPVGSRETLVVFVKFPVRDLLAASFPVVALRAWETTKKKENRKNKILHNDWIQWRDKRVLLM
jgi:hypothetical protein